jgi:hypothetical protein
LWGLYAEKGDPKHERAALKYLRRYLVKLHSATRRANLRPVAEGGDVGGDVHL